MKYYPITLHIHSVWERRASMEGHFYNAQKLGIHHMYLTDHDNRMGRRFNHIDHFDFSKGELMILESRPEDSGKVRHGFTILQQDDGATAKVEENALCLSATAQGADWSTVTVEFDSSSKRHEVALLAKMMLYLGMQVSAQDEDMRAMVDIKLSQRPPEFEFGRVRYVFGNAEGLESPYVAVFPMQNSGEFERYALNLLEDAAKVGGGDNVLNTISFSVSARNGKSATLRLNELKITSDLSFEEGRKEQQKLAEKIGEKYGVTPIVTSEISAAGPHKICFSPCVPIIDYQKMGYNLTDEDAMTYVQNHRGIYSRNHPFEKVKRKLLSDIPAEEKAELKEMMIREIVENRAWRASMIEIGYPAQRSGASRQDHLRMWDTLSAAGVFITGYGDSDNHSNDRNWFDHSNFVAYIGAEEPSIEGFIEGMLSGNLYSGDPVYIKDMDLSFESTEGKKMGQITFNPHPGEAVLKLSGLPEGCSVVWSANGEIVRTDECSGSYFGTCPIPTNAETNFVRVEAYCGDRCILITNPIYHIADPKGCKGKILFHIGDVSRARYAEIMSLICRIRPDVLVHTGDMVDDLKAGRIPEDVSEYKEWIPHLVRWMEKLVPEVYIVPGNNDLPEHLAQVVKTAKIIPPKSTLTFGNLQIGCAHRVKDVVGDEPIHLYGHGPTNDTHSFKEGYKIYANAIYGPTVVSLEDGHCIRLEKFPLQK